MGQSHMSCIAEGDAWIRPIVAASHGRGK